MAFRGINNNQENFLMITQNQMTLQGIYEVWNVPGFRGKLFTFNDEFKKNVVELPYSCSFREAEDFNNIEFNTFSTLWKETVFAYKSDIEKTFQKLNNYLQFSVVKNEQLEFISERLKGLRQQFEENDLNHLLSFNEFTDQLADFNFLEEVFKNIHDDLNEKMIAWYNDKNAYQARSAESVIVKCEELYKSDFFNSFNQLLKILAEINLLRIIYIKLEGYKKSVDFDFNPYPMIFQNGYSYNLFNYLISFENQRKISGAFISKNFYLFQHKELIELNTPWPDFFRYLRDDLQIDLKRIDERARPIEPDFKYFDKIQNNFDKKYTSMY